MENFDLLPISTNCLYSRYKNSAKKQGLSKSSMVISAGKLHGNRFSG
jgi:hypothetical protein